MNCAACSSLVQPTPRSLTNSSLISMLVSVGVRGAGHKMRFINAELRLICLSDRVPRCSRQRAVSFKLSTSKGTRESREWTIEQAAQIQLGSDDFN